MQRMEDTVLGDAVNTIARYLRQWQSRTDTHRRAHISAYEGLLILKPVGKWRVKGKEKEVMVYEVLG